MELPIRTAALFLYAMGILIISYTFFLTLVSRPSSDLYSSLGIFFNLLAGVSIGITEIAAASLLLKQLKKT